MPKLISATYHPNIEVAEFICDDGRHLLRSGGTLPWRINNPGDLTALMVGGVPAPKKAKGYVGFATTKSGRTFLIFPDDDSGKKELRANLKRMHGERTIPEAIPKYAPSKENNTEKYINDLLKLSGIPADRKISECNDAEIEKIMSSIAEIEGYHASPETRKETWVVVSTINATNGSQPLPDTEIILQKGGKEEKVKSDATGRFPPVIHPADKTAVQVKVMDPKTKTPMKVGTIEGDSGKDFNLLAKFRKWKGVAGSEKINSSTLGQKKPTSYVVQPGDSLGKIAKLYRTSTAAIMADNHLSSDKIYPGEVLLINGSGKEKSDNTPATTPKSSSVSPAAAPKKPPRPAAPPTPPVPSSTQPSDSERSKEGAGKVLALINPLPGRAPWMPIAIAEAKLRGGEVELTLQKKISYHEEIRDGKKELYGDENAWCAAFVNWCLMKANYPTDNVGFKNRRAVLGRAHGFYEIDEEKQVRNPLFVELDQPIYGAIAIETNKGGHGHHAGLVYAKSGKKALILLGGNQNQRINFTEFKIGVAKAYETKGENGRILKHPRTAEYLRYFVPISYYEQAKKDLADPGLEDMDEDELNALSGIKNERPKKQAKPSTR